MWPRLNWSGLLDFFLTSQYINPMIELLKFGEGNAKLFGIYTFTLPAGFSCPGASICLARAIKKGKRTKLWRSPDAEFTCYQATLESLFPSLHALAWHNFNLLKKCKSVGQMGQLIHDSLPLGARIIRVHVGGDYFSANYFLAWINVALNNPGVIFYSYTKSIHLWRKYKNIIPPNMVLTASIGGKFDRLITPSMKTCRVVFSPEEAKALNIPIDHDDSLAYSPGVKRFATLLHGKQKAGTESASALRNLKKRGMGVYNSKQKGYEPERSQFRVLTSLPMVAVNKSSLVAS